MIRADLGQHLEDFVGRMVESGRYRSEDEVLREGVRLVEDREARLAALDVALVRGIEDGEAGRVRPASAIFDRLEAKYAAMIAAAG